jgi:hypothetical protein
MTRISTVRRETLLRITAPSALKILKKMNSLNVYTFLAVRNSQNQKTDVKSVIRITTWTRKQINVCPEKSRIVKQSWLTRMVVNHVIGNFISETTSVNPNLKSPFAESFF